MRDLRFYKDNFPALRRSYYFNTGSEGLIPRDSYDVCKKLITRMFKYGASHPDYFAYINSYFNKLKDVISELGLDIDQLIKVNSISEGLNYSFNMLPLNEGDNILVLKNEFKTVILAAIAASEKYKANLIYAENIEEYKEILIKQKIKIAAISHVNYENGQIYNIEEIYDICNKNNVYFVVDGAQAFGNIYWNFNENMYADMYIWTTHKWAVSARGLGFIIPSEKVKKDLLPLSMHYFSTKEFQPPKNISFNEDIYDYSNHFTNFIGEISFVKTYRFLKKKLGFDNILSVSKENTEYFIKQLEKAEIEYVKTDSNLVSMVFDAKKNDFIVNKLFKSKVIVRTVPNTDYIRASIHFYNTKGQIDYFIKTLKRIIKN